MELTIRPKNFKLADTIETQIRKRVERVARHLDNAQNAEVVLTQQPTRLTPNRLQYVAQLTIQTQNNLIRSEVTDPELLTAMDKVIDNISRQIERVKGRHSRRHKGSTGLGRDSADLTSLSASPSVAEMAAPAAPELDGIAANGHSTSVSAEARPDEEEESGKIVRVKRFHAKPMDPEEAAEQMELLGHNFFVFWNSSDERINVIYRRNDGDYGLLEPERT